MASERSTYETVARAAARASGIDEDTFVRQITQESGWDSDVVHCRQVSSAGAQGIAQIVARFHPTVNPCDPNAALTYAANLMKGNLAASNGDWAIALSRYNAGPGATTQGLSGTLPGWPYAETVRYVSTILQISEDDARRRLTGGTPVTTAPIYDPDTPISTQSKDWECAEQSTLWAMTAFGRHPSDTWMEASMLAAGVESTEVGLTDASGAGLAAWITEQYGEFGYRSYNNSHVSFDDVRSVAGVSPVMIGGRNWGAAGHWVGVRRYDPVQDVLTLANPGGTGPVYGQQSLTRQKFAQVGPCSMVVVTHESQSTPPTQTPVDPKDARIADLEMQVTTLTAQLVEARSRLGYLSVDVAESIQSAVNTMRSLKPPS